MVEQPSLKHILITAEWKKYGTSEYKNLLVQLLSLKQAVSKLATSMSVLTEETQIESTENLKEPIAALSSGIKMILTLRIILM